MLMVAIIVSVLRLDLIVPGALLQKDVLVVLIGSHSHGQSMDVM